MLLKYLVVLVCGGAVVRTEAREGRSYIGWRQVQVCGSPSVLKPWLDSLPEGPHLLWLKTLPDSVHVAVSPNVSLSLLVKSAGVSDLTSPALSTGETSDDSLGCGGCPNTDGGQQGRQNTNTAPQQSAKDELGCEVILQDISSLITPTKDVNPEERMSWDEYHRYSTLMTFMEDLAVDNNNVELINLGVTLEGREINGLIIGTNAGELADEINKATRATTSSQRRQALTTSTTNNKNSKRTERQKRGDEPDVQEARDSDSNTAEREGRQETISRKRRKRKKMIDNKKKRTKQIIFIEAGSHAREWIAPAVGTYMAQQAADAGKKLLRHVTIIIVPLANPDGYEFAHTSDRFWRKNRRVNSNSECAGVDPNRNWDIEWESGIGSSSNPCSEVYQGPEPFSEEETLSLAWVENVLRDRITMFFSIHSFGKFVIFPWGYTTDPSNNFKNLRASANRITRTLNKQGDFEYIFGQTSTLLSRSAGGSDDYMHDRSVDISFTIELPDNSFILPPERILPVAEQMWAGLLCEIAKVSKNKKVKKMCKRLL
ncbi:hypothetical protein Pmani_004847 [Petrolisthes manimaculis]|uniref:Peptidase M14 domain-containing protein n=1 Tax=Petrolisthes manimaculis TaxID=1843537 RepID=A0AAE1UMU1_9EUCA|nr:hypothetical protein Pmani_004847 [Petrolisthes manimaculis]